jgi:predicted nucleotidyltransferase
MAMPHPLLTPSQRQHWLRGWAAHSVRLEKRRCQLLEVAPVVVGALRARWPDARVWLFGSALGPGFHADSDLDLAVAQLPADDLIAALDRVARCASRESDRLGLAPVAIDLVRLEALPLPWQQRIQRDGRRLG